MNYEPVIGIEVHVELSTASKMFCRDSPDHFGKKPNTHVCPICLGLPGSLPHTNKAAIEDCIKIGLALNCKIAPEAVFERKSYFYPDLPKGYQISQYRWPLCKNGAIMTNNGDGRKREIRINRVHMEEDTAKLVHQFGMSKIDFNRAGVPLVEIVTEPDFRNTSEIKDYAKKLQQLFRYLGVSNADMEKGNLRLEANISLRDTKGQTPSNLQTRFGDSDLPNYRAELKNINSFRFMVAAVEYEIKRQTEALESGEELKNETRGWDENRKQTYVQRTKEQANDYRYFPEPDIPPIVMDSNSVKRIKKALPELPWDKHNRFIKEHGLIEAQATALVESRDLADYFEEAVRVGQEHGVTSAKIANVLINKSPNREEILPAKLVEILREKTEEPIIPEGELAGTIESAIKENKTAVADFKRGKESALQFLVGQVMAKTRGRANPKKAMELLKNEMRKR